MISRCFGCTSLHRFCRLYSGLFIARPRLSICPLTSFVEVSWQRRRYRANRFDYSARRRAIQRYGWLIQLRYNEKGNLFDSKRIKEHLFQNDKAFVPKHEANVRFWHRADINNRSKSELDV